jgi:nucleotide-binding universal stress UspA family protein
MLIQFSEGTTMKTTRILVPDDFTEASREAVRYARMLAAGRNHELHLLHVVPDARHEPWAGGGAGNDEVDELDLDGLTEDWVRDAKIRLHRSACELQPALNVRTAVRLGTAAEQIVAYAAELQADLIVLGAHRDLRSAEWLRGSIAERVVRKASCEVLTVPGGGRDVPAIDEAPAILGTRGVSGVSNLNDVSNVDDVRPQPSIESVLIPIDFSANAELALTRGLALARERGAAVHVLYVYDPPWTRNAAYNAPPAHVTEELRYRAERRLARDIACNHGPSLYVRAAVRVGDPYVEIVHYAGEIRASLIVVGSHGRHTIGRSPLGSVAQKVLRRAPCPILTVHEENTRAERYDLTSRRTSSMMAG